MKVMTILGSPRKKGNTGIVLGWVEKELRTLGHEIDRVHVVDYLIAPCKECNYCMDHPHSDPPCIQADDANDIFERMMAADVILFASPIFFWGFTAQMKTLIDRMYCLVTGYGTRKHKSRLEERRFALLLTGADAYADNAEMITEQFHRLAAYAKCEVAGETYISLCTTPDDLGPDVHESAQALARKIAEPTLSHVECGSLLPLLGSV